MINPALLLGAPERPSPTGRALYALKPYGAGFRGFDVGARLPDCGSCTMTLDTDLSLPKQVVPCATSTARP